MRRDPGTSRAKSLGPTSSPSRRVRGYLVLSYYCIDNKRFRLGKLKFLQNFAALKKDKQIILKASLIILMVILFDLNRSHTLQDTLELIFRDGHHLRIGFRI